MALRNILICLLLLPALLRNAHAAGAGVEYRQTKGLLILEDFQQWTDLRYQYIDHSSNQNESGSSHGFQENYNASLTADILGPHIFNSNLSFGIGFDQNKSYSNGTSTSDNGIRYQYQFTGTGLDRSPYPFSIRSSRTSNIVYTPYAPSYTSDSTNTEAELVIQNTLLPSKFHFSHYTQDTSGGGFDTSTATNSFQYSATHAFRDISNTSLALTLSDTGGSVAGGTSQGSTSGIFAATNNLRLGGGRYVLDTSFQFQESKQAGVTQRTVNLSEGLLTHLGRALDLQLTYNLSEGSTSGFFGRSQASTMNEGKVILTHFLFKSLQTSLTARASSNDLLGGTEYRYSGRGDIQYRKQLSWDSTLIARGSYEREVVDRHIASSTEILQQNFLAVQQGSTITLALAGGVLRSIVSVVNSSTFQDYTNNPNAYTPNFSTGTIDIPLGSVIPNGTNLTIRYIVFLDPSLKFATDTYGLTTEANLGGGRYQVGATYNVQSQSLLSGPPQNSLRGTRTMQLSFGGHREELTYRLAYYDVKIGDQTTRSVEGTAQLQTAIGRGLVTLMGRERYNMYGSTPTAAAFTEIQSEGTLSYARAVGGFTRMTLQANALDSRTQGRNPKDVFSFRASLLIPINKMTISVTGQTGWTVSGGVITRDDTLNLIVTRYF